MRMPKRYVVHRADYQITSHVLSRLFFQCNMFCASAACWV